MLNEKFDSLLAAFGDTIGIPGLAADDSGISMLAFDDVEIVIQHLADGEMLLLYAYIGSVPPDNKELLYSYLLSSNSFFKETGGATLAVDIPTNAIGMHVAYPIMALDDELFENLLENFVNMAESWMDKIDKFPAILSETGFQTSAPSAAPMPPAGGVRPPSAAPMPPAGGVRPPSAAP
ncbi:MAG: type III secretion system chaperone, partial [Desulfovibrionaceae bacterium]